MAVSSWKHSGALDLAFPLWAGLIWLEVEVLVIGISRKTRLATQELDVCHFPIHIETFIRECGRQALRCVRSYNSCLWDLSGLGWCSHLLLLYCLLNGCPRTGFSKECEAQPHPPGSVRTRPPLPARPRALGETFPHRHNCERPLWICAAPNLHTSTPPPCNKWQSLPRA